jgi:hypothetical protein
MKHRTGFISAHRGIFASLFVTAGAALALAGRAQAQNASGWREHYDARLHVGLVLPAGWSLKSEGHTLVAQNADHTELVLAEAFAVQPGESAQTYVTTLGVRHTALFAQAQVTRTTPQAGASDTLLAALSYKNASGSASQARALCSVYKNSGMLYAIAGPEARFAQERPVLMKALQSLRFGPPPGTKSADGAGTSTVRPARTATSAASPGTEAKALGLKFVKWTDPNEHAFSVDVPEGWKVTGGANRIARTHVNQSLQLESPDRNMLIVVGDANLPLFSIPNRQQMQMYGVSEGVPFSANGTFRQMFLHYMPALEFNKRYLGQTLKSALNEFAITKEEEMPSLARQQTEAFNKSIAKMSGPQGQVTISIATTEFKGINRETNRPVVGAFASSVVLIRPANSLGQGNWQPTQMLMTGCTEGEGLAKRQAILQAALGQILRTWQVDPEWQQQLNQQVSAGTKQVLGEANAAITATGERSKQIASNTEAARQSIMGSYWKRVGAQAEQQRKFANYIGNNTDVRNTQTGQTYKVDSGYSSYYHDPRTGTILGTNSTTRPPIDFTPMQEF